MNRVATSSSGISTIIALTMARQKQGTSCLYRKASHVSTYEKEQLFRAGLNLPVGSPGWRRAWVARASDRQIVGHVDLRSHPVRFAEHRCLLGMGVDRNHRRLGLGAALLSHASEWALANTGLEWLDLEVLSTNEPAIRLYLRAGFVKVGEVAEMFKMDGRLFAKTTMTKRLREDQHGDG